MIDKQKEAYMPPHIERLSISSPISILHKFSLQGGFEEIEDDWKDWEE